jgi:hypothetical protein
VPKVIAMKWIQRAALATACLATAVVPAAAMRGVARGTAVSRSVSTRSGSTGSEPTTGWIVDRSDNICGLDDPKMLSKPAKIDYDAVLRATPEMKKIKDDKIDPNSPEGIQLRQAAASRVQKAAEKVRSTNGYCSVWKTIRHQDGRAIPDVTDAVKAQL